ncbi:MAG TPA: hypothetical protein VGJ31_11000 [Dongiaceae bacterium]
MNWQTVFDLETAGYKSWYWGVWPLAFAAIGVALRWKPAFFQTARKKRPLKPRDAGLLLIVVGLSFAVLICTETFADFHDLLADLRTGKYQIAEGVVTNFHPMPYTGHSMETFDVGDAHFKYSDYVVDAGFNNTASHGGPLRPGLHVRIFYSGSHILKLQIAPN